MKKMHWMAILLSASMLAGCSQPAAPAEGDNKKGESTLVDALLEASGDDAKAREAWDDIFEATAKAYDNTYSAGGDGIAYAYKEDKAGMIDDDALYDLSRDVVLKADGDTITFADLTDIDDSNDMLIKGYGLIGEYGEGTGAFVELEKTSGSVLEGKITRTADDLEKNIDKAASDNLMDAMINYGYIRYADPVRNASLYTWKSQKEGNGWKVTLESKDSQAFKDASQLKEILIDERNNRPVLALDDIDSEDWTFIFDENGLIVESVNNVYHTLSALDLATYVTVTNDAKVEKLESDELNVSAISGFLDQVRDGSLKDGSAFKIEGWAD